MRRVRDFLGPIDKARYLALLRGVPSVVRGGAVAAVSVVVPPFAVADRAPG